MVKQYDDPDYNQFVQDMEKADIKTEHYKGRSFYEGPAARCRDIQDVLSNTKVRCTWDQMGKGYIVYPK